MRVQSQLCRDLEVSGRAYEQPCTRVCLCRQDILCAMCACLLYVTSAQITYSGTSLNASVLTLPRTSTDPLQHRVVLLISLQCRRLRDRVGTCRQPAGAMDLCWVRGPRLAAQESARHLPWCSCSSCRFRLM